MTVRGACLCGAVAFELTPPLRDSVSCHCTQCRKTSGHYWSATSVPHGQFRLTREEGLAWYRSSATAQRGFCRHCGSTLFWQPEDEARISVSAGALEVPTGIREGKHIFTAHKGDYYDIPGNIPSEAEWNG